MVDDHLVVWAGMWAALDAAEEASGGDALRLVEQGLDNAAIAERLEVVTRIEAALCAIRYGVVRIPSLPVYK